MTRIRMDKTTRHVRVTAGDDILCYACNAVIDIPGDEDEEPETKGDWDEPILIVATAQDRRTVDLCPACAAECRTDGQLIVKRRGETEKFH
jgi:hypothetical protein